MGATTYFAPSKNFNILVTSGKLTKVNRDYNYFILKSTRKILNYNHCFNFLAGLLAELEAMG